MPGRAPGVGVEHEVARPRVAVARLADAAGVEQDPPRVEGERSTPSRRAQRLAPARRPRDTRSGRGCGRGGRTGRRTRRGSRARRASVVMYSHVGSRGLPWTRVISSISRRSRERRRATPASSGEIRRPVHSIARAGRRVEVRRSSSWPRAAASWLPRTPTRPDLAQPGDDLVGMRARSRPRRPRCQTASTSPRAARTASSAGRLAWMSERTAIRIAAERSAASPRARAGSPGAVAAGATRGAAAVRSRLTTGGASAPPAAGARRARATVLADHDQHVVLAGRRAPRARSPPRASRRRARRRPARRIRSSSRSARFQATRTPPGTRSGNASSTSSASGATARTVTAGQRSRWRRSAASDSARTAATADPVGDAGRRDGDLAGRPPSWRSNSTSRARSAGRARASGSPG